MPPSLISNRWRQIYNMVAFRNVASGTSVQNWWSGADYQIAFSRGNKAFIALNLESWDINTKIQVSCFISVQTARVDIGKLMYGLNSQLGKTGYKHHNTF